MHRCKFSHDLIGYLITKPVDIHFPLPPSDPACIDGSLQGLSEEARQAYLDANYSDSAPFVKWTQPEEAEGAEDDEADKELPQPASKDYRHSLSAAYCACYTAMAARGGGTGNGCPAGWKCRFLGAHVVKDDTLPEQEGALGGPAGLRLLRPREGEEPDATEKPKMALDELNFVSSDAMRQLGKRKVSTTSKDEVASRAAFTSLELTLNVFVSQYPLPLTKIILKTLEAETKARAEGDLASGPLLMDREAARLDWAAQEASAASSAKKQKAIQSKTIDFEELENAGPAVPASTSGASAAKKCKQDPIESSEGALDYARVRPPEKRRLDWKHGELCE